MSDDSPKPSPERKRRAFRPVEFEDAAANLLSLVTLASVWYYGNRYTNLEWHWLLAAGVSLGLLTYTLLIGPFHKLLTILKYVVLVSMLLAAVAFVWKIVHQSP
jgi:hypothetical protein